MKAPLALGLAALLAVTAACSKTNDNRTASQQARDAASDAKSDVQDALARMKVALNDTWNQIKDYTYQERADFSKSMDQMSKDLDDQAARLREKVSSASNSGSGAATDAASQAREQAHKEFEKARENLKQGLSDLGNATADGWAAAKAKVSDEWTKLQEAWDKEEAADKPDAGH
jgi:hypothetical protein